MEDRKVVSWICLSIICAMFCQLIEASVRNSQAMTGALPAYAMSGFTEHLNFTRCRKEMEEFRQAVDRRTLWALRMLDTNGQLPSGFISGQNYWIGDRIGCEKLSDKTEIRYSEERKRNNSLYRNPKEEFPPFELNFFIGNIRHDSVLQYHLESEWENIVLGLCLPATCTEHEVATMLNKMLDNRTLFADELYSMNLTLLTVSDLKEDDKWLQDGQIIALLFILVLLAAVIIIGTLYDVIVYQVRPQETEWPSDRKENINGSEVRVQVQNGNDDRKIEPRKRKPDNGLGEYLVCFSLYTNMRKICTMNSNPKHMNVIDGIKVLSVLWVDLIHSFIFSSPFYGNRSTGAQYLNIFPIQIISNGTIVVDTFFFISGFFFMRLMQLLMMQRMEAMCLKEKVKVFFKMLLQRYIRLAPTYYVLILLSTVLFSWEKQVSLFNGFEVTGDLCSKYWWRNVLFINNFFDWDEQCMIWSWFLPNDMQFYILGSFLLLLSITHRYVALSIGAISIVGSMFANAYTTYNVNYTAMLDEMNVFLTYLYIRPWLRVAPYLMGMGTCMLLEKWNYKINLSKKAVVAIWCVAVSMQSWVVFGLSIEHISLGYSVFYAATNRIFWSLGIGWIIIACTTNNAGFIEKFLSLKIYYPLCKLSYSAYLVNPFIIVGLYHMSSYPSFDDLIPSLVMFFGFATITYIAALILSASIEMPFGRLLEVYEKRKTPNDCA